MARLTLFQRLLRRAPAPTDLPPARPLRRATPGELRRERRALLKLREERLRDLGGLALEMYRRDRFRADLVVDRCAELVGVEARVHELDALLASAGPLARRRAAGRCGCGAPLLFGANFCANCGRAVGQSPVVACAACGSALAASAAYCPSCGTAVAAEAEQDEPSVEPAVEAAERP